MGSGKTSIGRRVARELEGVVHRHRQPRGARPRPHRRRSSRRTGKRGSASSSASPSARLSARGGVVALGGGAVLDGETRQDLAAHNVVLLTVSTADRALRIHGNPARCWHRARTRSPAGRRSSSSAERAVRREVADVTFDTSTGPLAARRERHRLVVRPSRRQRGARRGGRMSDITTITVGGDQPYDVTSGPRHPRSRRRRAAGSRPQGAHRAPADPRGRRPRRCARACSPTAPARCSSPRCRTPSRASASRSRPSAGRSSGRRTSRAPTRSSASAAARSPTSPASSRPRGCAAWRSCRCRRPCSAWSTRPSAARPGINTAEGKNLVGAFWPPRAVVCDLDLLDGLSPQRAHRRIRRGRQGRLHLGARDPRPHRGRSRRGRRPARATRSVAASSSPST